VLAARYPIPRQRGRDLGGSLTLNLLVNRGGEQLVVRVYRPSVSQARLEAIRQVRSRLAGAGVPCWALVPARDGSWWARVGGRLVEVSGSSRARWSQDALTGVGHPDQMPMAPLPGGEIPARSRSGPACGSGRETALAPGSGSGLRGSLAPAPRPRPR
jgi:hypothetical protein